MRSRAARLAVAPLALTALLASAGCADGGDGSADAAGTTASATNDVPARSEEFRPVIDDAYAVAIELWDDGRSFPTDDDGLETLAERVAATLPGALDDPGVRRWKVVVLRGDYGGNKGLIACTSDAVTVRLVVPENGQSIGFGVTDGEVASAVIYDRNKVGDDEQFNDEGFYSRASECATDDTELDAVEKASRRGRF